MTGSGAAARQRGHGSTGRGIVAAVALAAVALAASCVWMFFGVDHQRRALEADVAWISALREFERAILHLILVGPAPRAEGRPVRWRWALEKVRAKAPAALEARVEDVAKLATEAEEAVAGLGAIAGPEERHELLSRARSAVREAYGRVDSWIVEARGRLRDVSVTLGGFWNGLSWLILAACALALLTVLAWWLGRREARARREAEYRIAWISEQLPGVIWTVDRHLRFTSSQGKGLRELALLPDQVKGRTLQDYLGTDDPDLPPIAAHRRALAGETVSFEFAWQDRVYEAVVGPMCGARGVPEGAIGVALDVTEMRRTQAALEEERLRAQRIESLGILAGGIAHDFNNLLLAIQGNTSLLAEDPEIGLEDDVRLAEIERAVQRAEDLARQLLSFARGGKPARRTVDVRRLVEEAVGLGLHGSRVRACFDLPEDLWTCEVDAGQVGQALTNLAINAVQAMPEGGVLEVRARNLELGRERAGIPHGERYVEIAVRDHGPGVPQEVRERIFDPYFTTKEGSGGTGLGLAIVYSVAHHHGGSVEVRTPQDGGAEFVMRLPVRDPAAGLRPAGAGG